MLAKYLEKDLKRKMRIIFYLWGKEIMTSTQLANKLNVTSATIKSDIKTINREFCEKEIPLIVSSAMGYSILNKPTRDRKIYLMRICRSSLFIKAACFFLKYNFCKITNLEQEIYISQTKAYEIKNKVYQYFEELEIMKNRKVLPYAEIRIRFLMAFFQWEFDMKIVDISKNDRNSYERFFKEVEVLENCMFSDRSKEYARILFQISLIRRNKTKLKFSDEERNFIKKTIIYKRLSCPIDSFLKTKLRFSIHEEEMMFFALVFNVMNANYYDENLETYNHYVTLIKETTFIKYQKLLQAFEEIFRISLRENFIFEAAIVAFLRKCILNLQILIPEEHISLGQVGKIPQEMVMKTKQALKKWKMQTTLNLEFSETHVLQLTSKLFFILRKKSKPQHIYLLTSFYTDYLLGKEVLTHEYGNLVDIKQFNPTLPIDCNQENIVLYDTNYEVLNKISLRKLKINYTFDLVELQAIRSLLLGYDLGK